MVSKPKALSGFPEWLPQQRIVEQRIIDTCREVFELHGFSSLRTRAIETVEYLSRKGDIDKEMYGVRRLAADPGEPVEWSLRYDMTMPFARYVVENAGKLAFPFRRYQIQPAWRGERPQEGRYREFIQADIDIVDVGELPLSYDFDVLYVLSDVFERFAQLGLPTMTLRVNNRKVAQAFYQSIGIDDAATTLRLVDKLDKIGPAKVAQSLVDTLNVTAAQAESCLAFAQIRSADGSFADQVMALTSAHAELEAGLSELVTLIESLAAVRPGAAIADLSIARGLDYYTGMVYETSMAGYESLGSVSSGGRYESLATDGKNTYPGVGASIGLSRMLGPLMAAGLVADRSAPTTVLVALNDEHSRPRAAAVAGQLRARGIATLIAPEPAKFGKQIKFADRRGIPYVWFIGQHQPAEQAEDAGADGPPTCDQVKNIRSGEQADADANTWQPDAELAVPQLLWSPSGK